MNDAVIRTSGVTKAYRMWKSPTARLKSIGLHGLKQIASPLWSRCTAAQSKLYSDFYALRNIDLNVRKGETLAIVGRNGSGKSTLLQVLAGTLAPTSGTVEVSGRVAPLLELGSGFNPDFTGRENIFLNASILGLKDDQIRERLSSIIQFAEIGGFIDRPTKTYSSGMVLRLAFAVATHVDAEIMIIDESLAVGDAFFVQRCMRWIQEFKTRGTLLFVAHNMAQVVALCDRAVWLKEGAIALEGTAKEVTEEYLGFYNVPGDIAESGVLKGPTSIRHTTRSDSPSRKDKDSDTTESRRLIPGQGAAHFTSSSEYGEGKARILSVELLKTGDRTILTSVVGGEDATLRIVAKAIVAIEKPIIGFYLKDRLGQYLFGENSNQATRGNTHSVPSGGHMTTEFSFRMPMLPRGQYVFASAIATGSQEVHVQQHWIHDALILESLNPSAHRGLIGLPMEKILTTITS